MSVERISIRGDMLHADDTFFLYGKAIKIPLFHSFPRERTEIRGKENGFDD